MKKHLQKCLFEEKVCNLVTEISSKETGGIPEPNTNVILKRNTKNTFYKDDHLFFDKNTSKLVIDNKEIKLTPLEFKLLSLFLENQNQIILKETIIEKIWDSNENYVDEHTLLVNISRLRNKIEDDKHHYIKTVYGLGYRWCHDE